MEEMIYTNVITYLKNYAEFHSLAATNPDSKLKDIFCFVTKTKEFDLYEYIKMHNIYIGYLTLKSFSISEDYALNDSNKEVSDEDLNQVKNIINNKHFSNKEIVTFIRSAFSHNDDPSFDKFKFLEEGTTYEVQLKKAGFHEIIDKNGIEHLDSIIKRYIKRKATVVIEENDFDLLGENLFDELDKIDINYYYPKDKTQQVLSGDFIKTYKLNDKQKEKVIELINIYLLKNIDKIKPYLHNNSYAEDMKYFITKVLPVPISISNDLLYQKELATFSMGFYNNTFGQVLKLSLEMYKNEEEALDFKKNILNYPWVKYFPTVIYFDSIVNHLTKGENITINDITYDTSSNLDKANLRHCLAHGRWFFTKNGELDLYNVSRSYNKMMFDFDNFTTISLKDIKNFSDKYLESKIIRNKKAR